MLTKRLLGLKQVFSGDGGYGSDDKAMENCKEDCYASLACNYWQYIVGDGCWIEHPGGTFRAIPIPLLDGSSALSEDGKVIKGGEFIQHYCEVPPPPPKIFDDWGTLDIGDIIVVPEGTTICVV